MINKRLAKSGVAKQTDKTTVATVATFGFGLRSGRVIAAEIQEEPEEVTSDNVMNPGANRLAILPGMQYTTRGYPKTLGLLLYGALGGISSSGAGPYTHVITPADDVPYLTGFGRNGAEYYKLHAAKVDQLSLKWDGPGPIEVDARLMGLDLSFLAGAFTVTNDEVDSGGKMRSAGGTFKVDIDSAVPLTAPVRAGQVNIRNNIEAVILADSIKPSEVFRGVLETDVSLTLKPDDLLRWREIITGSAAGATISDVPIYGSYEVKFVLDANTDLIIAATRVAWLADFPEADPKGQSQDLVITGRAFKPAGAGLTATLRNTLASY